MITLTQIQIENNKQMITMAKSNTVIPTPVINSDLGLGQFDLISRLIHYRLSHKAASSVQYKVNLVNFRNVFPSSLFRL